MCTLCSTSPYAHTESNVPETAPSSHSPRFLPLAVSMAKNRPHRLAPRPGGSHSHRGYVLSLSSHSTPAALSPTPPILDCGWEP